MPNLHSAVKRMRVAAKARLRNKAAKSKITTRRRQMFEACAEAKADQAGAAFRAYCSSLDKAAIKGIIKKNTAIRRKRRAAARLAALSAAPASPTA